MRERGERGERKDKEMGKRKRKRWGGGEKGLKREGVENRDVGEGGRETSREEKGEIKWERPGNT